MTDAVRPKKAYFVTAHGTAIRNIGWPAAAQCNQILVSAALRTGAFGQGSLAERGATPAREAFAKYITHVDALQSDPYPRFR